MVCPSGPKNNTIRRNVSPEEAYCVFVLFCSVLLFSCLNDENKLLWLCFHFKNVKIKVTDWVATFHKEHKHRPYL